MGGVTALPHVATSVAGIRSRVADAAIICSDVQNRTAILVGPVSVAGHDLASLMMGMGVEVLRGPQAANAEYPPVLLVDAANLGLPAIRCRLERSRKVHPKSVVCAITGTFEEAGNTADDPYALFDDARACLRAAGIGFISTTQVNHAVEA